MRYKLFLDTNILISGIFFEGNESKILEMTELDLLCSEDVVDELKEVTKKKIKYLGERTLEIALSEIDKALYDMRILPKSEYKKLFSKAEKLITHKKDIPVLAAALYAKVNYLLTGDMHFFTDRVKSVIKVRTAHQFLDEIKKT